VILVLATKVTRAYRDQKVTPEIRVILALETRVIPELQVQKAIQVTRETLVLQARRVTRVILVLKVIRA
jgi:hypothetical protein